MTIAKIDFYLELIDKSHETLREFLSHLPEDILDWKVHEFLSRVRESILHINQNQMWIINYILEKREEKYSIPEKNSELLLEELLQLYDDFVSKATKQLSKVRDLSLDEERNYKEYSLNVEDWLFEYIHHLSKHGGEINVAHLGWKRKERALTS